MIANVARSLWRHAAVAVFLGTILLGYALVLSAESFLSRSLRHGLLDEYDTIAENLLSRNSYSASAHHPDNPTVTRGPVYPFYMAAIFGVFGLQNYCAVRLCDVTLHALAAGLLVAALRQVTDARGAFLAGALYAFWPTTLYYVAKGGSETMLCFWFVGALYALVRFRQTPIAKWALVLGVTLALACLTRGAGIVLVMITALSLATLAVRKLVRLRPIGLVAVAWIAVMFPWWARNYRLTGRFVPFHTLVWYNAYEDDIIDTRLRWLSLQGLIHTDLRDIDVQNCPSWVVGYPKGFRYPGDLHATDDLAQEGRYRTLVMGKMHNIEYLATKMLRNAVDFWSSGATVCKTRILLASSVVWLLLGLTGFVWSMRDPSVRWLAFFCVGAIVLMWGLYLPVCAVFRYSLPTAPFVAATIGGGWSVRSEQRLLRSRADRPGEL